VDGCRKHDFCGIPLVLGVFGCSVEEDDFCIVISESGTSSGRGGFGRLFTIVATGIRGLPFCGVCRMPGFDNFGVVARFGLGVTLVEAGEFGKDR